jgi:hypothetical protein
MGNKTHVNKQIAKKCKNCYKIVYKQRIRLIIENG